MSSDTTKADIKTVDVKLTAMAGKKINTLLLWAVGIDVAAAVTLPVKHW